jgi:hypothetical protein
MLSKIVAIPLFCASLLFAATTPLHAADSPPPETLVLRVHDRAAADPELLAEALRRVDEIYAGIGIQTRWETGDEILRPADAAALTVVIVPGRMTSRTGDAEDMVMGRAATSVRRAYVYYGRIRDAAVAFKRFPATLLGDVIAHEVGHLLLPAHSHSGEGVMRSSVPLTDVAQGFDDDEAETMRTAVRRMTRALRTSDVE